jgi:hypothetical protein
MIAAGYCVYVDEVMTFKKAGANGKAKDSCGKTAFDYAGDNKYIKDMAAYWALNDEQY